MAKFFELYVGKDSINGAFGQNLLYCIAFLLPSWKILKYSRFEYSRQGIPVAEKNHPLMSQKGDKHSNLQNHNMLVPEIPTEGTVAISKSECIIHITARLIISCGYYCN